MNNTIIELLERKSVRVYEDKQISAEDKETIITASVNAPTAGCMQLYTILEITDKKIQERLAVTCDNQPFISEAKMVLIYLADYRKWHNAYKLVGEPRNLGMGDVHLAMADACIAAQNAVTAAQSLGIGSCYIGDIIEQYEEVKEMLKLPEYVFPACMLVFGYPTKQQIEREKPKRVDNRYIHQINTYHDYSFEDYKDMWAHNTGGQISFEEYLSRQMNRKFNTDFGKEMSRSASLYFKDFDD